MELAAFAAKQHVKSLDGLSKSDKGDSPGRTLAQLKVPSLKTQSHVVKELSPVGSGVSPVKPLKALNELRPSVEIPLALKPMSVLKSMETDKTRIDEQTKTRNVIASPRVGNTHQSILKPSKVENSSTNVTIEVQKEKMTSKAAEVDASTVESDATGTKPPTNGDESDTEEFNFDDVDDEKEDVEPTKPVDEVESSASHETETRPATIDVEDLYDCPQDVNSENIRSQPESLHTEPRMFLPRASDIELFHVVLMEDTGQLERYLDEIPPQEMLEIVDTIGRTLYHYAALSKDKLVKEMIFQHVNSYQDAQFELECQALMRKKAQWMQGTESNRSGWVPPRVKELQRETTKQKCADWVSICSSVDENGRSFFHYIATTTSLIPVKDDYAFCSVLRTQPSILSTKDKFKKLSLHYAVEAGNLEQVKWYFQMGITLNQADVDLLLSFNVSRVMEKVILRQLEAIDMQNYYLPTSKHAVDENCDLGVSTFVLAKLQRITDNSAGRPHQLPLHRAAMFGNIRAVELLLDQGADPNARDANLWSPLHYCAYEATANHLSIAQLLMESAKSVDVNAKSLQGRSPLHVAVRSRKRRIRDSQGCESKDRLSFVTYLHECKADLDLKDNHGATPLLLACRGGDVGVVRFLLCAGCDSSSTGDNMWNPLHFTAIRGNPSMLEFLLSWDADSRLWIDSPGIQGRKPIDLSKNDNTRQMLVNLWTESYNGNVDQVRRLLLAKREAQQPSVSDKTAQTERTLLHLMILGYMNALQAPEPSKTSASSREERLKQTKAAELKRTAPSRFLQTVILLLQAGAELCATDKWGITPLMLAATIKDAIFMETLLDRLSDEDDLLVVDADGNTALHYSYALCQAQISTMLEDQIDDADIENKQGKSPFEMTGYREKIYPKGYREFLKQQQDLKQ